ncbi:GMC oxidoreductase [Streptomyces sp. NPDC041068]|uniref:GMC oxidoreductase n=1 Tax=Streptomyces sp. NPDC041068 TaxID=3155130 RepID=UPI0033CC60E0
MPVLPQSPPLSAEHHVVSDLDDVRHRAYDFVIVGGGGTAATFLTGLLRRRPDARVLVLEQGPFLLPSHAQNLGLAFQPLMASASASPWRADGDLQVIPQVPYLGGRTLVWSGSCPQPTRQQLADWPDAVVDGLAPYWAEAKELLGVRPAGRLGPEYARLQEHMAASVLKAARSCADLSYPESERDLDAPLAQGPVASGAVDKFSAVTLLLRAKAARPDTLDIVTGCQVEGLTYEDGRVVAVRAGDTTLAVGDAQVVLALGALEATRLVLASLPAELRRGAGANFGANTASFLTCRLPREAFPGLSDTRAELAALYVDGATAEREFHLHVTACATTDRERDLDRVYRLMPDMFGDGTPRRVSDEEHVVLLVHGLAQLAGDTVSEDAGRVRIDEDGVTVGTYRLAPADRAVWDAMDDATDLVLRHLAGDAPLEYWSPEDRTWSSTPPDRRMPFAYHEAGMLRMGATADDSVTDHHGRLHSVANVHVLGGAAFPTRGSWNPFLTMAALSLRLAEHLADPA